MGAGFTKEQANLPFAVSTFAPSQRRSAASNNLPPYISGETSSSAVAREEPVSTASKLSPFARLRARRRTITADASFDEQSSWWNAVNESDDEDDENQDGEHDFDQEGVSEKDNDQGPDNSDMGLDNLGSSLPAALAEATVPITRSSRRRLKPRQKLYPYAFAELQSFANINLCSSGIVKLSPNIGLLQVANIFQLCCNSLTSIPASITNLRNLIHLDLSNNQLTSLPESIGSLEKLLELRVSSNQLTHLPLSIKFLTNLQILAVAYNKLTELPSEVGALTALVDLDVAGNPEIRCLPAEIGRLKFLRHVRCTGCRLLRREDILDAEEMRKGAPVLSLRELCARTILRIDPLYHTLFPDPSSTSSREVNPPPTIRSSSVSSSTSNLSHISQQPQISSTRSGQRMSIIGSWKFRKSHSTNSLSSISSSSVPFPAAPSSSSSTTSPAGSPKPRRRRKQTQPIPLEPIPSSVLNYLESAQRCTFCGGPFLESYVSKFRFVPTKGVESDEDEGNTENHRLPLEYKLCINHWNDERGRIRAMFSPLPSTAPGRPGLNNNLVGAAGGGSNGMRRSQSGVLLGRDSRRESLDGNSVMVSQSTPHSRSASSSSSSFFSTGSLTNRKGSILLNNFREFRSFVLRKGGSGGLENEEETPNG